MIGKESIDLSLKNIWHSWFTFRKGKRSTAELHAFQYYLEKNLYALFEDLNSGRYPHGGYRKFVVCDNKRREISVASIRDRVVHRLIYDYLNKIYDKTFIDDAWSCRKNKGLLAGIERAQSFLKSYPQSFIWRGDVKKFFDSVDQETLLNILSLRIKNGATLHLLQEVIGCFTTEEDRMVGMPIGNLTSQIFANIYLNEFDRFIKHQVKPKAYLRYGDDFIMLEPDLGKLEIFRNNSITFLENELKMKINPKNDRILKAKDGLRFLGVILWPNSRILNKRSLARASNRLTFNNVSSYSGLIKEHTGRKHIKRFNWVVYEKLLH